MTGLPLAAFDFDADGDLDLAGPEQLYENAGFLDLDGDGISDDAEVANGTDPGLADSDGDGVTDREEWMFGTDPGDPFDGGSVDRDGDGSSDTAEVAAGTDPFAGDTDGDGLYDGQEAIAGSDPSVEDTDADGFLDGHEVECGSAPLDALSFDTDCDHLTDAEELILGTRDDDPDSDGDGLVDGDEVLLAATDPLDADSDDGGTDDGTEWSRRSDVSDPHDDWERHVVSTLPGMWFIGAGDLDGDTDLDVVGSASPDPFGPPQWTWFESVDEGERFGSTALDGGGSVADLDGDGIADLIGDFEWSPGPPGNAWRPLELLDAIPVDTDGDGDLDLVGLGLGYYQYDVGLQANQGGGVFSASTSLASFCCQRSWVPSDVDGDGDTDLVTFLLFEVQWIENLGANTFGPLEVLTTGTKELYSTVVADLDGDGLVEIVGTTSSPYELVVLELGGSEQVIADSGPGFAVGDLGADGLLELVRPNAAPSCGVRPRTSLAQCP